MTRLQVLLLALLALALGSCAAPWSSTERIYPAPIPPTRQLSAQDYQRYVAAGNTPFESVKPILDSRCVACHACYDAPCQLQLGSGAGIERGGSTKLVYDATRLKPDRPTRLFIDATTTAQWRTRGFHPVLYERGDAGTPDLLKAVAADPRTNPNLDRALLYRMLKLKRDNPTATQGPLPDTFDLGLDRKQQCTTLEEFPRYARDYSLWGMPYGLPGLSEDEERKLVSWIAQGAVTPPPPALSRVAREQLGPWETFLNGDSLKQRLVSRYLYEHLFLGHLHFAGAPDREFFRLVRSRTPPGTPIDEIATVRPFDDPGIERVYYRLRPVHETIVDKTHMPYELSPARMRRYRELFLQPRYTVTQLPSYRPDVAANPFKAYAPIPPSSRYRFLLDEAAYFVAGFMKGPVCRGQVALNVIQDRFWVAFYAPDLLGEEDYGTLLERSADLLALPTEQENAPSLRDIWFRYADLEERYRETNNAFLASLPPDQQRNSLAAIWDGEGTNPNAMLTVYRHFDSASVSQGLAGATPKTAWVMGYTQIERSHYLLVAGYDVFGTMRHQLATRLHFDFIRMESEDNFLRFMPADQRAAMRASWYRGIGAELDDAFDPGFFNGSLQTQVRFRTDDPKTEFFAELMARLGQAAGPPDRINRCANPPCDRPGASAVEIEVERQLQRVAALRGKGVSYLPELSYILVGVGESGEEGLVYSLVKNRELKNVSFMMLESMRSLPDDDNITIVRGFVGSYPNWFFGVGLDALPDFLASLGSIRGADDVAALTIRFGVRRTAPSFWGYSDWFNRRYLREQPIQAGVFDLNRYDNR